MVLKVRHWGSREPYVLLGSDTDFLCDLELFLFLICLLPACPVYLDSIDRDLQAFSAWCFQHSKAGLVGVFRY